MPHSSFHRDAIATAFAALCIALTATAHAQNSPGPQPTPPAPSIAAPADTPYPGTISLLVDVSNVADRVLTVHETIPVNSRDLTLFYPAWLPGTHSPSNSVGDVAGLVITANGKTVSWTRDSVDMYAFHVEVPKDATKLEVNFQVLAPLDPKHGRISTKFADVTWNSVLLYPAGYFSRDIKFETAIRLPEAWQFACSLDVQSQNANLVQFKETTLNTLIDSPLYAGVNFKRLDLSTGPDNQVFLDVFADKPADLKISPTNCNLTRTWSSRPRSFSIRITMVATISSSP